MRALGLVAIVGLLACRDVTKYSSRDGSYEGPVVQGDFVRAGVGVDARLCMTLDTDHLQDAPGVISTTDGRFTKTPLRPIPQIWHDPLSTLSFGDGRVQNFLYVATPVNESEDVTFVLSLMESGDLEVRMLRGAPSAVDAGGRAPPLFAVFNLTRRRDVPCP
ncbi:MAG TPA: hypothetical protein VIF62_32605 [Labilithrix sp.]|jgi:hypothetical protein